MKYIVIFFCICLPMISQADQAKPYTIQKIVSQEAPAPIGTYSQAIKINHTVYISGQIGSSSDTGELLDSDFNQQAVQVFKNIKAICRASGGDINNIAKLTVYLADLKNFSGVNKIMSEIFNKPYPARVMVQVSKLPKDAKIEVDAILYVK